VIPYVRQPEYLSPSSFALFEEDPIAYYKAKLGPAEAAVYEPPSVAMRVGSMFDGMLGCLWRKEGIPEEWKSDEGFPIARKMFFDYVATGGYERLLQLGIVDMQRELHGFVPETDVPIHGFADVVTSVGLTPDWKVSNAQAAKPPSPPKGYAVSVKIKPDGDYEVKQHKDFGMPLDQINERWAIQQAMYQWMLHEDMRPFLGVLHLMQPNRFTEYQAPVTLDFQYRLRRRLVDAWDKIQQRDVVPKDVCLELAMACV